MDTYIIDKVFLNEDQVIVAETEGENPENLIRTIFKRTGDYIKTLTILQLQYNIKIHIDFKQNINK